MLRTRLSLLALATASLAAAQDDPVTWAFSLDESGDGPAVLAEADVAEGWYVYSQHLAPGGPIPTLLDLSSTPGLEEVGEATERGEAIVGFDPYFDMEVVKYAGAAAFAQTFTLAAGTPEVSGSVEFMACTSAKCLPPQTLEFTVPAPAAH